MMALNKPTHELPPQAKNHNFLAFTPDELEIQHAAATFLSEVVALQRLHSPGSADLDPKVRREIGTLGWFSLSLPARNGGSGLSAVEHALFFRECGRECGPIDILAQVLAVLVAADREELRSRLSSGQDGVMLALRDGGEFRILGAAKSRYAILVEREAATLHDMSGVSIGVRPSLDPATSMGLLTELPAKGAIKSACVQIWQMAQLGAAAMLVGIAERAVSQIVEYAKVRETFGRKIGSYQAVRHPCADMELRAEAARSQLWYAAAALKESRTDAGAHLDAAKHVANEAALSNADVNIQLHGGIGVTDEHHAHLLLKRSLLLGRTYGDRRTLLPRLLHAQLED
jgi:alkylation response protein AidB-like acyl-CoA dehydrogenase